MTEQLTPSARPTIKRVHCASCNGDRNCEVMASYAQYTGDGYIQWNTDWNILKCMGCDYTFLQTVSTNSEEYHDHEGPNGEYESVPIETINYYPALSRRERPDWMNILGIVEGGTYDRLDELILELYKALDDDLRTLSAIGIRTVFDVASELLKINPSKTFAQKLDALVSTGHIGTLDRERIQVLVEAGHASAHRGWQPSPEDLKTMMDVLEHFVHDTFVAPSQRKRLDEQATKVKAKVPSRKAKAESTIATPASTPALPE